MSPGQERLWFLQSLDPTSAAYNLTAVLPLPGRVDAVSLARGLREVVRRQESLRTRIVLEERDEPAQWLSPVSEVARLPWIDLAGLPPAAATAEAERLARSAARRPFQLSRGPLLRTHLIALGDEAAGNEPGISRRRLLLSVHHVVADGGSIGVFLHELQALGHAPGAGPAVELPELTVGYGDYAAWKREKLRSGAYEPSLSYWRERLAGAPVAELPGDRPAPAKPSGRGGWVPFELAGSEAEALRSFARRGEATPFMAILAAYHLLLARWTGETDLVVGTTAAGRERQDLAPLIGFFANTLALRTETAGAASFRDLLGRVRGTVAEALEHQEAPFSSVVEGAGGRGTTGSTNRFFRTVVSMEERAGGAVEEIHSGTAKFDLSLVLQDTGDAIRGVLEYSSDLFDRTTVLRAAGHLRRLLAEAIAEPDRPPSDLGWLTPPERQQVVEWNAGAEAAEVSGAGEPELLHARFAAWARTRPDAVALAAGDRALTYGETERRAHRLARTLRQRGVGPGVLVGLCAERSPAMVVAILGILEAGGAYLPLDPKAPRDRLAFVIEDAGAPIVLVEAGLGGALPDLEARGVLTLPLGDEPAAEVVVPGPEPDSEPDPEPDPGLDPGPDPDDLAYVIYTSGSTGRPKGSWISHRNVGRLLDSTEGWLRAGTGRRLDPLPLLRLRLLGLGALGRAGPRRPPRDRRPLAEPLAGRVPRPPAGAACDRPQPDALRLQAARLRRDPDRGRGVGPGASQKCGRGADRPALRDLRRRSPRAGDAWPPGSPATATGGRAWSTCTASPRPRST